MVVEITVRSQMATTALMVSKVTTDSLEGLKSATCSVQPSQGKFAVAGCQTSSKALLSPDGNIGVQSPDILEGLFKKSQCNTRPSDRRVYSYWGEAARRLAAAVQCLIIKGLLYAE